MLCDSAGGINILLFINYPLKTNKLIEKEVGVRDGELNEGGHIREVPGQVSKG